MYQATELSFLNQLHAMLESLAGTAEKDANFYISVTHCLFFPKVNLRDLAFLWSRISSVNRPGL